MIFPILLADEHSVINGWLAPVMQSLEIFIMPPNPQNINLQNLKRVKALDYSLT